MKKSSYAPPTWKSWVEAFKACARDGNSQGGLSKRKRSCNLTDLEMKAIYDMGFRHFKLQGRADIIFYYAYDLTRYMLEPRLVAPLVYKTLLHSICSAPVA